MTLDEYKEKIEEYMRYWKVEEKLIKKWMRLCENDIIYAYQHDWEIESIALPIMLGY